MKFSLPSSGRVEVLHNGKWGTICDDYWNKQDADVVCHQLGYDGALRAVGNAAFGQGTGQIWLDDVQCKGDELSISDCTHSGWGAHNCYHRDDAGIVCRPAGKASIQPHLQSKQTSFFSSFFLAVCAVSLSAAKKSTNNQRTGKIIHNKRF